MKKFREDLDNLMKDVEKFIVEKNQMQFISPLRYRLNILDEKFEKISLRILSSSESKKIEEDLQFCKAILY